MPPVKLNMLRVLLLLALLPCISNTAEAQLKLDSFRFRLDSGSVKTSACLNMEGTLNRISVGSFFWTQVNYPKIQSGFSTDLRIAFDFYHNKTLDLGKFRIEQGIGFAYYKGRPRESLEYLPDGTEVIVVVGYEKFKMLMLRTYGGKEINMRNTRLGIYALLENDILLNEKQSWFIGKMKIIQPYAGIELRWKPGLKTLNPQFSIHLKKSLRTLATNLPTRNSMIGIGLILTLYEKV